MGLIARFNADFNLIFSARG